MKVDISKITNQFTAGKTRERSSLVYYQFYNIRIDFLLSSAKPQIKLERIERNERNL